MVKNIAKTLLFWVIFLGLFLGISNVFIPKDNTGAPASTMPEARVSLAKNRRPWTCCLWVTVRLTVPSFPCGSGSSRASAPMSAPEATR